MQAKVSNLYFLGIDGGGLGDTNAYVATVGHTWSLSPTMLIDGNFGMNWQDQTAAGSDFGTDYGTDDFGIPGTNGPDPRQSGMPAFNVGLSTRSATAATWHPLERHEKSYTITTNLTKLAGAHEFRAGFDFIRYQLDHWQPELGIGPARHLQLLGQHHGAAGLHGQRLEPVRRLPAGADERLRQEHPVRRHVGSRESVRRVRQRSLEREREADAEPGLALRILSVHDARGSRPRAA